MQTNIQLFGCFVLYFFVKKIPEIKISGYFPEISGKIGINFRKFSGGNFRKFSGGNFRKFPDSQPYW